MPRPRSTSTASSASASSSGSSSIRRVSKRIRRDSSATSEAAGSAQAEEDGTNWLVAVEDSRITFSSEQRSRSGKSGRWEAKWSLYPVTHNAPPYHFVEDLDARVMTDGRGKMTFALKQQLASERSAVIGLLERMPSSMTEQEAADQIEALVPTRLQRGYDAPLWLPVIFRPPLTAAYVSRTTTPAQIRFAQQRVQIRAAGELDEAALPDPLPSLDEIFPAPRPDWTAVFAQAEDERERVVLRLTAHVLVQLDEQYRATRPSAPSMNQRFIDFEEQMRQYDRGFAKSIYNVAPRFYADKQKWHMFVGVSSSAANNPGGLESIEAHLTSEHLVAENIDPLLIVEYGNEWAESVRKLAQEANSSASGMHIDTFRQRMVALKPAARISRQGGAGPGERHYRLPPRSKAEWMVWLALTSASSSESSEGRGVLYASDPVFRQTVDRICLKQIRPSQTDPALVELYDAYDGRVLLATSCEKIDLSAVSRVDPKDSADHVFQVLIEQLQDGSVRPIFHAANNVVMTSALLNRLKHRYNLAIFFLLLLTFAMDSALGYITTSSPGYDGLRRRADLVERIFAIWPIPCPHFHRKLMSPRIIVESERFVRELCDAMGVKLGDDFMQHPTTNDFEHAVDSAARSTEGEIARLVELHGLSSSDVNPSLLPASTGLTTARPSWREAFPVSPDEIEAIKVVGSRILKDYRANNVEPLLNVSGLPSLSLDGSENLHRVLQLRQDKSEKIDGLVMTSGHDCRVPFAARYANKGALNLSPSHHQTGDKSLKTGFSTCDPHLVSYATYNGSPSIYLDAWALNSAYGAANADEIEPLNGELEASATAFLASERGRDMAWLLKSSFEWSEEEKARMAKVEEILQRFAWLAAVAGRTGEVDLPERATRTRADIEGFGIAGRTWEAAYLLRQYLTPPSSSSSPPIFDPPCPLYSPSLSAPVPPSNARPPAPSSAPAPRRTILELGSGTGFLSLSLAPHLSPADTLVLTDLDNVCPLLEKNLETARRRWAKKGVFQSPHPPSHDGKPAPSTALEPTVLVRPLPWGSTSALAALRAATLGSPDMILASDLIYFEFLYAPLLRTLIGLTEPRSRGDVGDGEEEGEETGPIVIFSYKIRSLVKEQPFWEAFGRWFRFEAVQLGTPLPPPSPPSSPSCPSSATSSLPPSPELSWSRFGAATPSSLTNPTAAPGETDELYVFLCQRWPETLGAGQRVLAEGEDGVRDEELLLGRGKARGFEEGAGQFEEMLLLGQEWDW